MTDFVDVIVTATGQETRVPADWVGDPVLGVGIELVPVAARPVDPSEAPTERDTVEVIDKFAADHGIELGDAGTKAEKVAVINQALVAAMPPTVELPPSNPDVQTVAGQASTESPYPYVAAQQNQTGGTGSPVETPAAGEEEN
jgi:hypothetical protein